MRTDQVIMLSYDLVQKIEIDLGIDNIRSLHISGVYEEQFVEWVPQKFVMLCKFKVSDSEAASKAIDTAIKALYRRVSKPTVKNLTVWLNDADWNLITENSQQ